MLLEVNKHFGVSHSVEYGEVANHARWYLAMIWLKSGKLDDSKELALKTINWIKEERGAQHEFYTSVKEELRRAWGINPDGTPFEGSVELETDDSSDEWETDNSSEAAAETPGQGNAEQR